MGDLDDLDELMDSDPDGYVVIEVESGAMVTTATSYERAERNAAALRDTGRYPELDVAPIWL